MTLKLDEYGRGAQALVRPPRLDSTAPRAVPQRLRDVLFGCDRRTVRQVLVVGAGQCAGRTARQLLREARADCSVLGYVDDGRGEAPPLDGAPCLGNTRQIDRILAEHVIDEVIVALSPEQIAESGVCILEACRTQGIAATLPLPLLERPDVYARVDRNESLPVLRYSFHRMVGGAGLLKRTLDVLGAGTLLLALAPLFLLVAIWIRLDSSGPAFFVQRRVGMQKRPFRLIKFRTMVCDAESRIEQLLHLNEAEGPVFKLRADPRITRVGRWLRRSSIDELPQLINVLLGEMSLVGPRPLPLRDVAGFRGDSLRRRFSVRPGITGPWQVSGRSGVSFSRWMELDLQYIENWTLGMDLKILLRTIPAVLRGTGAH